MIKTKVAAFIAAFAAASSASAKELTGEEVVSTTTTYSEQITGEGHFRVTNGAKLTLNGTTSTFTGGVIVDNGTLETKNSLNATYPYAGTGDITLNCTGNAPCVFNFSSKISNNVIINGNSSKSYPATNQGGGCELLGTVTADGDFYIGASGYDNRDDSMTSTSKIAFSGVIDASGHKIATSAHTLVNLANTVKCDTLHGYYSTGSRSGNKLGKMGGFYLGKTGNTVGHIILDHQALLLAASAAVDGATVRFEGQHLPATNAYNSTTTSYINIFTGSSGSARQKFKWIESDECSRDITYGYELRCSSATGAILEIQGEADTVKTNYVAVNNAITIEQKAPATFKQVFMNRRSKMTGTICVNGGTMELAGTASFENVPSIAITNGEMIVSSTDETALALVRTISLGNNGKFTVVEGANPLEAKAVAFELSSSSLLTFPAGSTFEVIAITVDGEVKPATTYTHATLPQLAEGTSVKVLTGGDPEITWTGAAGTANSGTKENWSPETVPDFSFEFYHPTFATGGTRAEFGGDMFFNGLNFEGNNDFTIATIAGQDASITLWDSPLVCSEPIKDKPRTFTIEPSLAVKEGSEDQTWVVKTNDTLNFQGAVTIPSDVTVKLDGGGNVIFSDLSNLAGVLNISKANPFFTGAVGTEGNNNSFSWSRHDSQITLSNAVINLPVSINASGMSGADSDYTWMVVCTNTTNTFKKQLYSSASVCWNTAKGATVIVEGDTYSDNTIHLRSVGGTANNPGVFNFKGRLYSTNSQKGSATIGQTDYCKLVFDGLDNFLRCGLNLNNCIIDCRLDDQFCVRNGAMRTPINSSISTSTIKLNNHHEEFGRIYLSSATISGDYPATIASIGGAYTNITSKKTSIYTSNVMTSVKFNGWVGLEVDIRDDLYFDLKTVTSASYGDITVKRGTLRFDNSSTWLNGTNVVISGTGKVEVQKVCFGAQSVVRFTDTGTINIPDNVTLHCAAVYVDGVERTDTIKFTKDNLPTHITGNGSIVVGDVGTMLIIK